MSLVVNELAVSFWLAKAKFVKGNLATPTGRSQERGYKPPMPLPAPEYHIVVENLPDGYSVKSLTLGSANVKGKTSISDQRALQGITVILFEVRFKFDPQKSDKLRKNPKRAIGFEEIQEVWPHPYYLDTRLDIPEQFRAIGWAKGQLYTVIFEIAEDKLANTTDWSPCGKPQKKNRGFMNKTHRKTRAVSAEAVAKRAERGEDVAQFFTNKGRMMPPIQRVNVDFAQDMLQELDVAARELNVSRQAVIKILVRQALNQHYLAQKARQSM